MIDRKGSVFPRGTGLFLVIKGVHIASFCSLSDETLSFVATCCMLAPGGAQPLTAATDSEARTRTDLQTTEKDN